LIAVLREVVLVKLISKLLRLHIINSLIKWTKLDYFGESKQDWTPKARTRSREYSSPGERQTHESGDSGPLTHLTSKINRKVNVDNGYSTPADSARLEPKPNNPSV